MKLGGSISEILREKGSKVWFVPPEKTVFDAIQMMADRNVGALPVMDGDRLVGILSERDYTRKVVLQGKSSKQTSVREIMSTHLVLSHPADSVEDCMRLMTENRVRHVPVMVDNRMVGLVSIGDLVKWIISAQSVALDQLENYIAGGYPG